jgi:hypothetical protein
LIDRHIMSTEPEKPRVMWRNFPIDDDSPVWLDHHKTPGGKFPAVVVIPLIAGAPHPSKRMLKKIQQILTQK